ncbi:SDR family oxidoreductase [Brevibacillus invocatus]|uniref:SDR family oxidoreductase n=1 Tax=Brevibacillus invocatus TaxID=173959 RepID=A0A3M8BV76_9BACL|nr:SDR family oxidoreductase [Brevibacillus invocatus]
MRRVCWKKSSLSKRDVSMPGGKGIWRTNWVFRCQTIAKYAIVGLTEAAAKELAGYQITVNAIKPGIIRSALTQGILGMAEDRLAEATPLKRIGDPEDIAKVVSMLVQPETSFVTGISVVVDGGFHLFNEMDQVMLDALGQSSKA